MAWCSLFGPSVVDEAAPASINGAASTTESLVGASKSVVASYGSTLSPVDVVLANVYESWRQGLRFTNVPQTALAKREPRAGEIKVFIAAYSPSKEAWQIDKKVAYSIDPEVLKTCREIDDPIASSWTCCELLGCA